MGYPRQWRIVGWTGVARSGSDLQVDADREIGLIPYSAVPWKGKLREQADGRGDQGQAKGEEEKYSRRYHDCGDGP